LAVNEVPALIALGRWDEALALVDQFLGGDLNRWAESCLSVTRAEVLVRRGDPRAADAVADLDRFTARSREESAWTLPVAMAQAEHALNQGDPDTALTTLMDRLADLTWPTCNEFTWPALHTLAKAVATVEQDTGAVQQQARDTVTTARQAFTPYGNQQVWDTMIDAELTPPGDEDTVDRWDAAHRAVTDPAVEGPVHLRGYTAYRLGSALLDQGRRGDAGPLLAAALDQARALRAAPLQTDITTLARRARIRLPGVDDTTPVPAGPATWLTPREHEVLLLVAEGRSNAQIADELFISPKTVSVHVSNILAKLGANSRGEAAAKARRDGLLTTPTTP
jgi:DNA-binding CsgD family transcriptional regulator